MRSRYIKNGQELAVKTEERMFEREDSMHKGPKERKGRGCA